MQTISNPSWRYPMKRHLDESTMTYSTALRPLTNRWTRSKSHSLVWYLETEFSILRQLIRIQQHLEPIVNNDQLLEALRSIYDKGVARAHSNNLHENTLLSKTARRLLVLVFVQICQQRLSQIERLSKLIPLVFRTNDHHVNYSRSLRWMSACVNSRFEWVRNAPNGCKNKCCPTYRIYPESITCFFGFPRVALNPRPRKAWTTIGMTYSADSQRSLDLIENLS